MSLFNYINSHVARLATRYVGQYLEGIEPEKFEVAWKGGNLQLSDVQIRPQVVDLINLPVAIAYGWVGNVKISLPLSNLFSVRQSATPQPLFVELKELFLVVIPKPEDEWDEEALLRRHRLLRQRRLDECDVKLLAEHAKERLAQTATQAAASQPGWMARLAARIMADVQFRIQTVHIRYEHKAPTPALSFSMGVILPILEISTPKNAEAEHYQCACDSQRLAQRIRYVPPVAGLDSHHAVKHDSADCGFAGETSATESYDNGPTERKLFRITDVAVYWNSADQGPLLCSTPSGKNILCDPATAQRVLRLIVTKSGSDESFATDSVRLSSNVIQDGANAFPLRYALKPFSCSLFIDVSTLEDAATSAAFRGSTETHCVSNTPPASTSKLSKLPVNCYRACFGLARLSIAVHKSTLRDLAEIVGTVKLYNSLLASIVARNEFYKPYRPEIPVTGNPRIWWRYAVGCVVRRLRHDFPEAFAEKDTMWTWDESLKRARVNQWKAEYRDRLSRMLMKAGTSTLAPQSQSYTGDTTASNSISPREYAALTRLQDALPEHDLLETYVETKREFLRRKQRVGRSSSGSAQTISKAKLTPKKSGGWSSWLGLHPASTTSFSPAESQDEKKAMDHAVAVAKDVSPPDSDDDVFFDVEDVDLCTTSQPQQQASLKFPIWENNEEAVCADVENGSVSDSDPQEHDFFDPEELSVDDTTLERKHEHRPRLGSTQPNEREVSMVAQQLLETGVVVAEIFLRLEAASVELELDKSARLLGKITATNLSVRIDDAFAAHVALKDCCLWYELPQENRQFILARPEALDKELLSVMFCSKHPLHGAPQLIIDVQHVVLNWIPSGLQEIAESFDVFSQRNFGREARQAVPNSTPEQSNRLGLVSLEQLSVAKQLMYKEYRNAVISVAVEVPTIILPSLQTQSNALTLYQTRISAIAIHLGALSIISEKPGRLRCETHPFSPSIMVVYNAVQRFSIQLRQLHVEYLESYDLSKRSGSYSGERIIDHFEIQVRASLSSLEKKLNLGVAAFAMRKLSPKHHDGPIHDATNKSTGYRQDATECHSASQQQQQLYHAANLPQNTLEVHGDLPELGISLNRRIFDGLLAAFNLVSHRPSAAKNVVNRVGATASLMATSGREAPVGALGETSVAKVYQDTMEHTDEKEPSRYTVKAPLELLTSQDNDGDDTLHRKSGPADGAYEGFFGNSLAFHDSIQQIGWAKRCETLTKQQTMLLRLSTNVISRDSSFKKSSDSMPAQRPYCSQHSSEKDKTLFPRSTLSPSHQAQVSNDSNKERQTTGNANLQNHDESEDTWPPSVQASFSLVRFKMTLDCSFDISEIICVVTDRTVICYNCQPGLTGIVFKMGQLTLFRQNEPENSQFRFLLKTEAVEDKTIEAKRQSSEVATWNYLSMPISYPMRHQTKTDNVAVVSADNLIFVQITLASLPWSQKKYSNNAPMAISVTVHRPLKIIFQPRPLRYFMAFWKHTGENEHNSQPPSALTSTPPEMFLQHASTNDGGVFSNQNKMGSFTSHVPLRHSMTAKAQPSGVTRPALDSASFGTTVVSPEKVPCETKVSNDVLDDALSWVLRVCVLGVSCVCVESDDTVEDQRSFALCTFENATIALSSKTFGTHLFCELKNLVIEDLQPSDDAVLSGLTVAQQSKKKRRWPILFRVLPGGGSLVTIRVTTTDKTAPIFDGTSSDVIVDIGEMEIVCFVAKLLRIFHWLFDGFLETLTATSATALPPISLRQNGTLRPNCFRKETKNRDFMPYLEPCDAEPVDPLPVHDNTTAFFETQKHVELVDHTESNEKRKVACERLAFRNKGAEVLTEWMIKAASCFPRLGVTETEFLTHVEKACSDTAVQSLDASEADMRRMEEASSSKQAMAAPLFFPAVPPLTLRTYKVTIRQPALIIPVSVYDGDHSCCLTVSSIVVQNKPAIHRRYGLLDDINITFQNVVLKSTIYAIRDVVLCGVNISVHLFRSLLSVNPPHPTWMTFDFSDVSAVLSPTRLGLLINILNENILGDDPDAPKKLPVVLTSNSPQLLAVATQIYPETTNLSDHNNRTTAKNSAALSASEVLTSRFEFTLPGLFIFFTPEREQPGASSIFHADLLKCCITKNVKGVTTIQTGAKSAKLLYCDMASISPFSVLLSDSREDLTEVFSKELECLQSLMESSNQFEIFPADVKQFIMNIPQDAPAKIDALQSVQLPSDVKTLNRSSKHNVKKHQEKNNTLNELSCVFTSQFGVRRTLTVHVCDPRIIYSKPFMKSTATFFSCLQAFATDDSEDQTPQHRSPLMENRSREEPEEHENTNKTTANFHLDVDLIRASVIIVGENNKAEHFCSSSRHNAGRVEEPMLLVMRGGFHAAYNRILSFSADDTTAVDDVQLEAKTSDISVNATTDLLYLHHYTIGVTAVELFITDLHTLSAVELFQQQYLYASGNTDAVGAITDSSVTHLNGKQRHQRFVHQNILPLTQILGLPAAIPSAFNVPLRATLLQPFSLDVGKLIYSSEESNSITASCRDATATENDSRHSSKHTLPAEQLGANPPHWRDVIRLLCPKVECSLDMTVRSRALVSTRQNFQNELIQRHVVLVVQPVSVEISYSDIIFLQACYAKLAARPAVSNTEAEDSVRYNECFNSAKIHNVRSQVATKFNVDITEAKLLVLNDSEEFSSAPFIDFQLAHGTLYGSLDDTKLSGTMASVLNATAGVAVRFFNPRAVAYEPIIENLVLRVRRVAQVEHSVSKQCCSMRSTETDFSAPIHKTTEWNVSFLGSKKQSLCINITNVFVAAVISNFARWKHSCEDVQCHSLPPLSFAPSLEPAKRCAPKGMFRFTPYTLLNKTGVTLLILPLKSQQHDNLLPFSNAYTSLGSPEKVQVSASNQILNTLQILRPNKMLRLTQLPVDVRETLNTFAKPKLKLQLWNSLEKSAYALDGVIPVDRLGVTIFRVDQLARRGSVANMHFETKKPNLLKRSETTISYGDRRNTFSNIDYMEPHVICRVKVAEGQKRLTVESQVSIRNDLAPNWGIEVAVCDHEDSSNVFERPGDKCAFILIPPLSEAAVPVFSCLHPMTRLFFRPVFWKTEEGESTARYYCDKDTYKSSESPSCFIWSRALLLARLWKKIRIIENERQRYNAPDANQSGWAETNNNRNYWFPSLLPTSLPVDTLRCSMTERATTKHQSVTKQHPMNFYFCVATDWETFSYRNTSCRQLRLILSPPFRLRSVVPIPIGYTLRSGFKAPLVDFPQHNKNDDLTTPVEHTATGVIALNQDVPLFSMPLLETGHLCLNLLSDQEKSVVGSLGPQKDCNVASFSTPIFYRHYPSDAIHADADDPDEWRRLWIKEGGGSVLDLFPKRQTLVSVIDPNNSGTPLFSVQLNLENPPGQPVVVTLYSPVWIFSDVGLNHASQRLTKDAVFAVWFHSTNLKQFTGTENTGRKEKSLIRAARNNQALCWWRRSVDSVGLVCCVEKEKGVSPRLDITHKSTPCLADNDTSLLNAQKRALEKCPTEYGDILEAPLFQRLPLPWCFPLDCTTNYIGVTITSQNKKCIYYSNDKGIDVNALQTKEMFFPLSPVEKKSEGKSLSGYAEVAVYITENSSSFLYPVKFVTLTHRYYLQNNSGVPLVYRQQGTTKVFSIPEHRAYVPLDWADHQQPQLLRFKLQGNAWQWGGRICLNSLSIGEGFVCHIAIEFRHVTEEMRLPHWGRNIRIEKQRVVSTTGAAITVIVFRSDSPVLPDALRIVNTTRYRFSIRQHQSSAARAFQLDPTSGTVDFGWDDMLLPKNIYILLDAPECRAGAVVRFSDICAGNRELLRFGDAAYGTQFWCFLAVKRCGPLKLFELYEYTTKLDRPRLLQRDTSRYASIPTRSLLKRLHNDASRWTLRLVIPSLCVSVIGDLRPPRIIRNDGASNVNTLPLLLQVRKEKRRKTNNVTYIAESQASRDLTPHEFVCIYLDQLRFQLIDTEGEQCIAFNVTDVQIDHCSPTAMFPVLLQPLGIASSTTLRNYETRQLMDGVQLAFDIENHPLLDLVCIWRVTSKNKEDSTTLHCWHFKVIRLIVLGLILKADMGFVTTGLDLLRSYEQAAQHPSIATRGSEELAVFHPLFSKPLTAEDNVDTQERQFYVEQLVVHPLLLHASFIPATPLIAGNEQDRSRGFDTGRFLIRLLSTLGSIQDIPIYFQVFKVRDSAILLRNFTSLVCTAYTSQFWSQSYALASNMDLLGNPLSTLSHLGAGLGDLVAEPVRAYNNQQQLQHTDPAISVLNGLGRGARSLWDNTVYGTFNVVSKVSGVAAQGLGVLALDEEYIQKRQQQEGRRRHPKDASEGLSMGAEAFGKAVVGGLKGLVAEPARAVEAHGLEGFIGGVGRGVVGALVKPVAGIFEMTALAAGGIQEAAGESSGIARGRRLRRRPPRLFYGPDRILRHYSIVDATLHDLLLYAPKLEWDTFAVDTLLYDEARRYLWVLTHDELLTIILKHDAAQETTPEPHIYCELWQIMECQVVTQFTMSKKESLLRPPSIICDSAELVAQRSDTERRRAYHHYNSSGLDQMMKGRSKLFQGGIILALRSPLPNRYVTTSTLDIASRVAELINARTQQM